MRLAIVAKNELGGGGSRFLAALRGELRRVDALAETVRDADVILCNSHHLAKRVLWLKWRYPNKIFLHRIDGPMSLYTQRRDARDEIVRLVNEAVADGTVYQSRWSQKHNTAIVPPTRFTSVITNAPDPALFNTSNKISFSRDRRTRLVAMSWSTHQNKGESTLQWLDGHLDFKRYSLDFASKTTLRFAHIQTRGVLSSAEIAAMLKQADILIFPSRIEACSNALLEGLHCGLPVLAYDGGSNREIVRLGGELFRDNTSLVASLEKIVVRYEEYVNQISVVPLQDVAQQYLALAQQIAADHSYAPKKLAHWQYQKWRLRLLMNSLSNY